MFSTRTGPSKWDYLFRPFKFFAAKHSAKENEESQKRIPEVETLAKTVRAAMKPGLDFIVPVKPVFNIATQVDTWLNYSEAIDWCQENCLQDYDFKIFYHQPEENNDWKIADSPTGPYSAFFAFGCRDEALIFSIKFKN